MDNVKYFVEHTEPTTNWSRYLIKEVGCVCSDKITRGSAFFDEGADFCGVSEAFLRQNGMMGSVVDRGTFEVTFGNGKTESIPNRTIALSIFVDDMSSFDFDFNVCLIPNDCDLMMGVPWKRQMKPIIDWTTDRVYDTDDYVGLVVKHGKKPPYKAARRQQDLELRAPVLKIGNRRTQQQTKLHVLRGRSEKSFHFSKVHGMTRYISMKQAKRLVRKKACEFVVILPQATINALHATWKQGGDFLSVYTDEIAKQQQHLHAANSKTRDKTERQARTDLDSFKLNPAFPLIKKFETIFRTHLPKGIPVHGEHEMELTPGHGAVFRPQWRLSPEQTETLRAWLEEMLQAGLIRPSISPHGAPTFCIRKPVGWRIVHDYRAMNEHTIRQSTPMPRKDDILDRMAGCRWYSCFDLLSGYYQIRMRDKDIPLTAFQTPDGLFEYLAVPMGLSNAPATFNRIVTGIFKDLADSVATYFDDIYVFTRDEDINIHLAAVEHVFQRCLDRKLYLKLAKSTICSREIPCLGDFVGLQGVRIDPDKVTVIKDWPTPRNVKDLQSFLGTTVYVQRFCRNYSEISAPLFNLVKSKAKVLCWTSAAQSAFDALKMALSKTPVLALPDFSRPFRIRTDASQFAIGGVLFQTNSPSAEVELQHEHDTSSNGNTSEGIEHPIAFTGRKLTSAELNYPTHEQEMLAIIHCLNIWRIYLIDGGCTVETDHRSLEKVLTQKSINRRICRWYDQLADYNLKFNYIPGETNTVADALSRRSDFEVDFLAQKNKQMFVARRVQSTSLIELIRRAQATEKVILNSLLKNEKPPVADAEHFSFSEVENLVFYNLNGTSRIWIPPENEEVQNAVLWELHDSALSGHPGIDKTIRAVQEKFYWRSMVRRITQYIKTCQACQRSKGRTGKAPGFLRPLEVPTARWESIGMDFITGLPMNSNHNDAVLVIADRLTKRAHFIETKTTISAEEFACLFLNEYVRYHGIPRDITSDRDSKFTSTFWQECARLTGTKLRMAAAYQQRTDGQVERINAILAAYLRSYVSGYKNDWADYLALAEFAYNRHYQASIQMTPFFADLGYNPRMPVHNEVPTCSGETDPSTTFLLHMEGILRGLQAKVRDTANKMKLHYDKGRRDQSFQIGDMVLVSTKNLSVENAGALRRKLAPKWIGPYEIVEKQHGGTSYRLNLPPQLPLYPVFHTMNLKLFKKDESPLRHNAVPTVRLKDGSEGYLIEDILEHRLDKDGLDEYKCKWVGKADDITWEPVANLQSVPGLIKRFLRRLNGLNPRGSKRLLEKQTSLHHRQGQPALSIILTETTTSLESQTAE